MTSRERELLEHVVKRASHYHDDEEAEDGHATADILGVCRIVDRLAAIEEKADKALHAWVLSGPHEVVHIFKVGLEMDELRNALRAKEAPHA